METLIEDEFGLYKRKNFSTKVTLTAKFLKYNSTKLGSNCHEGIFEETILIHDVIGCACMKSICTNNQHIAYLTIYAYQLIGKRNTKRVRKTVTFAIKQSTLFEENLTIASKWRATLYSLLYSCETSSCIKNEGSFHLQVPLYRERKKVLIFINPKSGPGLAYEIYKCNIKPVLLEAEVGHELIVTSYSHHAYEVIQNKNLSVFAGIIIIAGDGLLYEVYNGLLQRSDRDIVLSIPIGIIPGGSGNGLARSIAYHVKEPYLSNPVLISTLNIVNPVTTLMDLVLINTESGKNYISFISIGYGIMADIDIESERFRTIGEARFTVYALARILNLRKYRARLSYKPAKGCCPYQIKQFLGETNDFTTVKYHCDNKVAPISSINDGLPFREDASYQSMNLSGSEVRHSNLGKPSGDSVMSQNNNLESPIKIETFDALNRPLSDDWLTIEDDFISIYAVTLPFIGSDKLMSPKSKLNDGIIWLSYLNGNFSRSSLLKYLLAITDGKHINIPGVTYIPVTDLRIEPLCSTGKVTIDGELIDLCSICATVLPGKGRVMTRRS